MYLRCKGCGAEIMLGKTFSHSWGLAISETEKTIQLEEFLNKHSSCCDELESDTCGGISPFDEVNFEPFELTYENQNDWGKRKTLQQLDKELHPENY